MESGGGKKKSFILGAVCAVIVMILIRQAVVYLPVSPYVTDPDSLSASKKTRQIMRYVDRYYLGDVDRQQLADTMYLGLVAGLGDPYSTYFTKDEYETVTMTQHGEYRGIGITITTRAEDGLLQILAVTPDGPAEKAGVKDGDLIRKINGEDFSHATTSEAADAIRGIEEDTLELTVYRESTEEELTFTISMEKLESYSVRETMLEDGIGYIEITSFTTLTAKQFDEARKTLEEEGMKALIVDLRVNRGGLVSGVYDTLNSFMPEGLLFYTENKNGSRKEFSSKGENVLEVPMAVLVSENTASAAEIFSGAVKDHDVAVLIGTVTFGKGIVQDSYVLADGSVLKLTVSHYYTPNGTDIHTFGITPDIEIENTEEEDLQFEKAVEILKEKTAQ